VRWSTREPENAFLNATGDLISVEIYPCCPKETGLTPQTVYRIKGDPAGAEAALGAWGL
jgi:hypothetical protein